MPNICAPESVIVILNFQSVGKWVRAWGYGVCVVGDDLDKG
jgi:hypothetical protein